MFNLLTLISGAYVGGKIIKESLEPERPYSPPPKPVIPDALVVDRARYEHDKALYPTLAVLLGVIINRLNGKFQRKLLIWRIK